MKHFIPILSILTIFLFLSGCTSTGTGSSQSGAESSFKGTRGISLSFLDNLPPSKIYLTGGGETFDVSVEVKNLGTTSLRRNDLVFTLGGMDRNIVYYNQDPTNLENDLDGKTSYMPEGGFLIQTLTNLDPDENEIGSEYNPTLVLSAYYNYETEASIPICVDPNAYNPQITSGACTAQDVSLSGGQGAPVAVTKVEQVNSPDKVIFKLYFSNVGGGTLFTTLGMDGQNIRDAAGNGIDAKSKDKLEATVSLSGGRLTCQPDNKPFRVTNVLYCTYDMLDSHNDAFSTVLNVDLEYGYKQTIRKSLNIVNMD